MSLKPTMSKDAQQLHDLIVGKILSHERGHERDQQTKDYILGISDMGWCREYARHMVLKTPRDPGYVRKERYDWAAMIGRSLEGSVLDALQAGDLVLKRGLEVSVVLPSGLRIKGHPDAVLVGVLGGVDVVIDVKTKDGLAAPMKDGADLQQQFQRRLYGHACKQEGLVSGNVKVGNLWLDRSASSDQWAWVELEDLEDYMLDEVDQWLSDVTYAVTHDEPAMQDQPYHLCETVCPFFVSCRGDAEPPEVVDDPHGVVDRAAAAMREATALEREAKDLRRSYREEVEGITGKTERFAITSTRINESETPAQFRKAHTRVTIRERKR